MPLLARVAHFSVRPAVPRLLTAALLLAAAASGGPAPVQVASTAAEPQTSTLPATPRAPRRSWTATRNAPILDTRNVHAAARANMLPEAVRGAKPLGHVPHTNSRDVWVIDSAIFEVVAPISTPGPSGAR